MNNELARCEKTRSLLKYPISWDATPCRLVHIPWRFGSALIFKAKQSENTHQSFDVPSLHLLFSTRALQPSRLIVRSALDVPTFATKRLHASPSDSTQRWKVELWARNVRKFCLNSEFHIIFRDHLHAVKLRHGTDGFISPPKEGVLKIFSP